jgi:hypothetical protein
MKNTILSLILISVMAFAISSCGGSSVQMSAEMQEFVGMIKGKSADVSAALTKFGASDEIINNDMGMYDLADPKVTAKEGDCYTAQFQSGAVTRIYSICWKDGKITGITEKEAK